MTLALAIAAAGCSKKDDSKTKNTNQPAKTKATPTTKTKTNTTATKQPAAKTDLSAVMDAYTSIHANLAADKTDVKADATKLVAAAKSASVPDAGKQALAKLATAADTLAKVDAKDADAVRKAYGEVSRATVALLSALPDVAKNYHVFECPMAKGYKRWVESSSKLHNPYMGTKMPTCGSEVAFGDKGKDMGKSHNMGNKMHDMH